jgi:hypothetical protein
MLPNVKKESISNVPWALTMNDKINSDGHESRDEAYQ